MRKQTRELRVQKLFVELSERIRSLCAKHFKAHNDAKVRKISILNSTKPQEIGDRHSDLCVTFRWNAKRWRQNWINKQHQSRLLLTCCFHLFCSQNGKSEVRRLFYSWDWLFLVRWDTVSSLLEKTSNVLSGESNFVIQSAILNFAQPFVMLNFALCFS